MGHNACSVGHMPPMEFTMCCAIIGYMNPMEFVLERTTGHLMLYGVPRGKDASHRFFTMYYIIMGVHNDPTACWTVHHETKPRDTMGYICGIKLLL